MEQFGEQMTIDDIEPVQDEEERRLIQSLALGQHALEMGYY